jgi:hypothetical protein
MEKKNLNSQKVYFTHVWSVGKKRWDKIEAPESLFVYIDFWGRNKDGNIYWAELKLNDGISGALYKGVVVKETICNKPLRPTQKRLKGE